MAELKPCPFCGRIPIIEDCGENRYFVKCKCGIEQSRLYCQKCDAVRRWNRRKPKPRILGKHADVIIVDEPQAECEITDCDYHDACKMRGQTDCPWK